MNDEQDLQLLQRLYGVILVEYTKNHSIFFWVPLACWSHNADSLISLNLIVPLLELYMNTLHCSGWNSAAVITSVNSSILAGLISTMSKKNNND